MGNSNGRRGRWGKKFWTRVNKGDPDECWEWTGPVMKVGYGRSSYHGVITTAHRVAWLETYGPDSIPEGRWLLHSCDNRRCCNPKHLRVGTAKENTGDMMTRRRDYWSTRTHCKNGHEYTPENTRTVHRANGSTYRQCARCKADSYQKTKV